MFRLVSATLALALPAAKSLRESTLGKRLQGDTGPWGILPGEKSLGKKSGLQHQLILENYHVACGCALSQGIFPLGNLWQRFFPWGFW